MSDAAPAFVHLRVHTEFSLVDGIVRIQELVAAARDAGMPAVAVTDQSNLFGMVKFYRAALAAGVKPIIGCDVWLADEAAEAGRSRLTLLCRDAAGYRALSRLLSRAYLEGTDGDIPVVERAWLRADAAGLLALSGGAEGDVGRALLRGDAELARRYLREHRETFGEDGFYLEVHRLGRPGDEHHLHAAVELAAAEQAPVVATNDVRFMAREDFDAHEVRVCIHESRTLDDPSRPRRFTEQQYLADPADMAERFADLPEALETSVRIAERCSVDLELGKNHLPDFPVPEGYTVASLLREEAETGLGQRLVQRGVGEDEAPEAVRQRYQERLDHELAVIEQMGFPGYFLIVADFIRWARASGIPVGPGRGSGAGSLVAYALGITNLDPLRYDLLFERFLNPERVSMPDFDVDFCMERRDEVIEYVSERYGAEKVSQIATHGTMAARAVVRDVGRVHGHAYGYVDRIAKLIPFEPGMTLDKALEQEPDLRAEYDNDETVRELLDTARRLEGMSRNVGKHAGGVVIAPTDLTDFSPLYRDPEEREDAAAWKVATHFDKDDVEAVGLVKFDFLGLRTLTIIDWTVQAVNRLREQRGEPALDIDTVPLDDAETFELLKRCATTAVFQLESRGMKELIKRLQPDSFEDIIALVALFRPGPLQSGMVEDFVERKHGRSAVAGYPTQALHHPDLVPVLQSTYGVILYQEQVQRIAQVLAGYSLGQADLLRRAMGKKKPEEMAKQRAGFLEGAQAQGLSQEHAEGIFDLVEKFAGYGFNKCVHGDTRLIEAHTGERVTVAELFRQRRPFSVHAEAADGKLVPRPVTDVVWNGRKPVFELRTAQGRRIRATAGHRFRTWAGWRRLEALAVGDRVATARRLPVDAQERWPAHELIVLAGLLAEGNTCHPGTLYFYGNDAALVEDFAAAASRFPNTVVQVSARGDGRRLEARVNTGRDTRFRGRAAPAAVDGAAADLQGGGSEPAAYSGAFEWAQGLGLLGCRAAEKRIPEAIFRLCDADIERFLGRLWAGDGFVCSERQFTPYYATSSRALAEGVSTLLLRLGMINGIHEKRFRYRGGERPGYTVHLLGEGTVETFLRRLGPHLVGRQAAVERLAAYVQGRAASRSSLDTIPAAVRDQVDAERRRLGLTWAQLEQGSGVSTRELQGRGSRGKRGFRRRTVAQLARYLGAQRLAQAAASDLYWDRVVAIEPQGVADTYDLTVDTDHNYVAEGLVTHNSHSAAYALLSYQTAWLKAHEPAAFMASVLSSDMDNTDKVVTFIDEARAMRLEVQPPDINRSANPFVAVDERTIVYGLGAIKGVGESALDAILGERDANGPFTDLFELCRRVDTGRANRRVLEALCRSGSLDPLVANRATGVARIPAALAAAEQATRDRAAGQSDLFGGLDTGPVAPAAGEGEGAAEQPEWPEEERLAGEKETLGLFLTGHPIDRYEAELPYLATDRLQRLASGGAGGGEDNGRGGRVVTAAGLVIALRVRNTSTGGRLATLTLDDRTGRIEAVLFPEAYSCYRNVLGKDLLLVVRGSLDYDDFSGGHRITAEEVLDLPQARERALGRLVVPVSAERAGNGLIPALREALTRYGGGASAVHLDYRRPEARARVVLGGAWTVRPCDELLRHLEGVADGSVRVEYPGG
ncbi:DNA polymerase III subunit alpha [Halorhodospira neutriphila]|uniref:DNA polymerase III subunit alpha n=1 Tax=Halorhodospira neutriphila TaxID=168379 RepID=A0ABS1E866_9GAMM|nr:DNA polymerase III subunit alpha [Halorhodospira neutriphila]